MFEKIRRDGHNYGLSHSVYAAHHKILKYIENEKKVLDVGCSTGYLGEELKKKRCFVVGIEAEKNSATIAEKVLDKVIIDDVENLENLPFADNFFDVIIFADILEHLKRPDIILKNFKKYLKKDGYIIVSVPNIARIDMRIRLLFGKFDYRDGGILDRTHLRFFTRTNIYQLLDKSGYLIKNIDYTGIFSNIKIFRFLMNLLAFQFILVAQPK